MNRSLVLFLFAAACGGDAECPQTEAVSIETSASSGDEAPSRHLSSSRPAPAGAPATLDGIERFRVPIGYAPAKGSEEAAVTIVTFSDFECPFCRRVQETLERVEEEYGPQVRWVFRQNPLPFHQNAMPAAIASMEAYAQGGPELFYRVHDALFAEQRLDRETILRVTEAAGADRAEVERAIDDERWKAAIEADQELARRIGARGTPNFFINGRQLTGAQPFDRFQAIIDEELRIVAGLRERGVPANQIYASLTWRGNAGAGQGTTPTPPARRTPDPAAIYNLPLDPSLPAKGPADALVTIAMVSDFQCPFCSRALPTVDQILQHYGNDVRVVWLNNPLSFHTNAMPAAELALEAHRQQGDTGFWAMHDILFQNQRALDRASLEGYARQRGLNMRQVTRALDSHTHRATIEAQQRTITGLGATGTPSFFINGRNVRGAQQFAAFQTVIDEELARARQLIQNGTPRRDVYQEAIRNGATTPQYVNAQPAVAPSQPQQPTHYAIAVPRNAPRRGASNRRAQIVIQQFADFECPFCDRVRPTVDRIVREYPTVQIVWRDYPLPFHQHAQLAHEAAREVHRQAGDRGFWQYHDLLYDNRTALEEADLISYARQIRGVNINRFRRALTSHRHQQAVEDDMEAVRNAGARIGTPSFFINGRLLQGAQPFEAFKTAIDEELAAAANP